jgi:hypothetical protein
MLTATERLVLLREEVDALEHRIKHSRAEIVELQRQLVDKKRALLDVGRESRLEARS